MRLWIAGSLAVLAAVPYWLPYVLRIVLPRVPVHRLVPHQLSPPQITVRVRVIRAFLAGVSDGLRRSGALEPPIMFAAAFDRPFWVEGVSVGLTVGRYFAPRTAKRRLETFNREHARYLFLLTIGRGFAQGVETLWRGLPRTETPVTEPRLAGLFHDGFGFQQVLTRYPDLPAIHRLAAKLPPGWQPGFYEGIGRALWFFIADPDDFLQAATCFPTEARAEAIAGYGIAQGFAGIAEIPNRGPVDTFAEESLRTGLVIGLFARYYIDPEYALGTLRAQGAEELSRLVQQIFELYERMWAAGGDYRDFYLAVRQRLSREGEGRPRQAEQWSLVEPRM